jgi:RNase H-fold protein (predicted Holliday junction resolvase)
MAAFSLADQKFANAAEAADQASLRTYTEANEFKNELSSRLGETVKVENFSCAGGMVSDVYIFLKALIDTGRIPHMVLYGISPRDFTDNLMPPLGQSPLFEVVSDWGGELPSEGMNTSQKFDLFCASYSYFYKTRRKYKNIATAVAADTVGRPISLYRASEISDSAKDETKRSSSSKGNAAVIITQNEDNESGTPLQKDLKRYAKRYIPINQIRLQSECDYLTKLVRLCEKNRVIVVFIGMPLTSQNRQLIPPQLETAYGKAIARVQGSILVKWVDMASPQTFEQNDFSDSAHLNRDGSKKFQRLLLEKLTADPIWQTVKKHQQ